MPKLMIAVIGGNEASPDHLKAGEQIGRGLARDGVTIVCGGLGGVMEAVCKGAKEQGGTTIGILPGQNPRDANPWVDFAICTSIGYARNILVVKSGMAVIAVDGSYGTLSEIGHALSEGIPVIGLDTWNLSRNGNEDTSIIVATDPDEAVRIAIGLARQRSCLLSKQ